MKPPPRESLPPHPSQPGEFALEPVSGPSFPLSVKIMASALMLALLVFGAMNWLGPAAVQTPVLAAGEWWFIAAVAVVIGTGYWGIMTGRTSCDGRSIEQTWLWHKQVQLTDITQVKLISVSGLHWLVVPRLVVRTGFGLTTFHAGDAAVFSRFKLLAHGG